MHAVRPVSNAAHVVRAVRTMLTRTRVTCGALPARGARRRVASAFHETDTMKPLVLAIALALTLPVAASAPAPAPQARSEEHTSELQSLMRIPYAVFCLTTTNTTHTCYCTSYTNH